MVMISLNDGDNVFIIVGLLNKITVLVVNEVVPHNNEYSAVSKARLEIEIISEVSCRKFGYVRLRLLSLFLSAYFILQYQYNWDS